MQDVVGFYVGMRIDRANGDVEVEMLFERREGGLKGIKLDWCFDRQRHREVAGQHGHRGIEKIAANLEQCVGDCRDDSWPIAPDRKHHKLRHAATLPKCPRGVVRSLGDECG